MSWDKGPTTDEQGKFSPKENNLDVSEVSKESTIDFFSPSAKDAAEMNAPEQTPLPTEKAISEE